MNIQKFFLIILSSFLMMSFFTACKKEDNKPLVNELEGLKLATTFTNNTHSISLYTTSGTFQAGYNEIFFQVKTTSGNLVNNVTATWSPMMYMMSKTHSCPASAITKKQGATSTYTGHLVFQMATNASEYWELSINYVIDGVSYSIKDTINVTSTTYPNVVSFKGSDSVNYILSLVAPKEPKVAVNDMAAVLYKMESMMSFVPVNNYTIKIDPRMPAMGNHSSPNNVHLTQGTDNIYRGKLSLTMTGYWKVNLQVVDAASNVLKGEAITGTTTASSIFFDVEF